MEFVLKALEGIFSIVFIDYQLFNFYKFSSVLMVFTQNVVDLL